MRSSLACVVLVFVCESCSSAKPPEAPEPMQVAGVAAPGVELPLEHIEAQYVADVLVQLLQASTRGCCALPIPGRAPLDPLSDPRVAVDTRTNSLVLSGFEGEDLVAIQELIARLDVAR